MLQYLTRNYSLASLLDVSLLPKLRTNVDYQSGYKLWVNYGSVYAGYDASNSALMDSDAARSIAVRMIRQVRREIVYALNEDGAEWNPADIFPVYRQIS